MDKTEPEEQKLPVLDVCNLNALISYWRKRREEATTPDELLIARCYVDAFQTVRVNHGLPLLPLEEG